MISPKGKLRIKLAVKDYQDQFADEYKGLVNIVIQERELLDNEDATTKDSKHIDRLLFILSEKLSTMIDAKLDEKDFKEWQQKDSKRWFAKEFPQFRITKNV